jgi:hypothetical protein
MDSKKIALIAQLVIGAIVIIVSLVILALQWGDQRVWIALLSYTAGIAVPSPIVGAVKVFEGK